MATAWNKYFFQSKTDKVFEMLINEPWKIVRAVVSTVGLTTLNKKEGVSWAIMPIVNPAQPTDYYQQNNKEDKQQLFSDEFLA